LPVTTSYPGVYIEELPSTSHSVTPAPTAVTVFVGYTNPFWRIPGSGTTPPFGDAVELFSFADYQANFGGFFSSPWLPDYVGRAVFQFFLNGGSDAFVVSLKAGHYFDPSQAPPNNDTGDPVVPAQADLVSGANGFTFTGLVPVGVGGTPGIPMTLTLSNITTGIATDDTADLTIVYGTRVETYRRVAVADLIQTVNSQSSLASVALTGVTPASYDGLPTTAQFGYATVPHANWTVIDPTAFAPVFAANAPLDKVAVFNLLALPGLSDPTALAEALAYCESKRAFFVMDAPANAVADRLAEQLPGAPANPAPMADIWNGDASNNPVTPAPPVSRNGAIYFPYLQTTDPVTGAATTSPPSGFVTGIMAREDNNRGVWKSPAGLETTILGTTGVVAWGALTDPQQGVLNRLGVNCLRTFPGIGSVVFGARTLVSDNPANEQWKYVAVRRMALFIEQSLYASLKWAVFEPNDTPLWTALTQEVQAFMLGLFRQAAFAGTTADQAFQVQCDSTTTTQTDIDNGVVNILVGFAPLKPAEFVVVQITQLAGQTQS
jgi:phage tail sheath protein FI